MVFCNRDCEYTECQVVAIVYNGNEDISVWFCNLRVFLGVTSYFH